MENLQLLKRLHCSKYSITSTLLGRIIALIGLKMRGLKEVRRRILLLEKVSQDLFFKKTTFFTISLKRAGFIQRKLKTCSAFEDKQSELDIADYFEEDNSGSLTPVEPDYEPEEDSEDDGDSDSDTDLDSNIDKVRRLVSKAKEKINKKKTPSNKKVIKTPYIFGEISIDTEFDMETTLTLQGEARLIYLGKSIHFVFIIISKTYEPCYSEEMIKELKARYDLPLHIFFHEFDKSTTDKPLTHYLLIILREYIEHHFTFNFKLIIYMYYSMRDIRISFGSALSYLLFTEKLGNLQQTKRIYGEFKYQELLKDTVINFKFIIKDLYGIGLKDGGLKGLMGSVGMQTNIKSSMDIYKKRMKDGIVANPMDFVIYAIDDAMVLFVILERKQASFNWVLRTFFFITDEAAFYTTASFPFTVGTQVYTLLKIFINYVILQNNIIYQLCLLKLGILNNLHKDYGYNLIRFNKLQQFNSCDELYKYVEKEPAGFLDLIELLKPKVFYVHAWQYCSSAFLAETSYCNNNILGSIVSGGRTVNERPLEGLIKIGADGDIAGAYGTVLYRVTIPFGRPRIVNCTPNEEPKYTLGTFMDKYHDKMELNLYKLVVSGLLSFFQDLVPSKVVDDSYRIKTAFTLYRICFFKESMSLKIMQPKEKLYYISFSFGCIIFKDIL